MHCWKIKCVPDSGSTFEGFANGRVSFKLLEGLERMNVRVLVVQTDHKANGNQVVGVVQVVQK